MDIETALRTFKNSLASRGVSSGAFPGEERPLTPAECVMVATAEAVERIEQRTAGPGAEAVEFAANALHDLIALYATSEDYDPHFVAKGKAALRGLRLRPEPPSAKLCPKCGQPGFAPAAYYPSPAEQDAMRAANQCVECGRSRS